MNFNHVKNVPDVHHGFSDSLQFSENFYMLPNIASQNFPRYYISPMTFIDTTSPTGLATHSACADAVTRWHIRNYRLLNPTETEAIVTGTRQQIAKLEQSDEVTNCGAAVLSGSILRVLRVTLISELTFDEHVTVLVRACNFHLGALRYTPGK